MCSTLQRVDKEVVRPKKVPPPHPFEIIREHAQDFLARNPPQCDPNDLLSTLPKRWSLYPPLVLLPPSAFTSIEWQTYLPSLPPSLRSEFYKIFTSVLNCTHLAINTPIQNDTLRSPCITPLHGDFGETVSGTPSASEYPRALWVRVTQNGIKQTWAPLYTMFSRGNITEKQRILTYVDIKGAEVADLFVGIGYFAFSYLKAGAKRVWGWDLNPWSVEALRRGAEMNKWTCVVDGEGAEGAQIMAFNEDNKNAVARIREAGVKIKHVNLGLLPSSERAWQAAAEILSEEDGWIHVHGNARDSEIDAWSMDVVYGFQKVFKGRRKFAIAGRFRVKEFGPGVGHYVLDLVCSPLMQ